MLCYQDCCHFSGLSQEEIEVIAEHDGVPEIVAAEVGRAMLQSENGANLIKVYILENLNLAIRRGQSNKAEQLVQIFIQFDTKYPSSFPSEAVPFATSVTTSLPTFESLLTKLIA